MPSVDVPDDLYARYERLAAEFDDFGDETELIEYLLEAAAIELERDTVAASSEGDTDEAVKDRLKQLGYIE